MAIETINDKATRENMIGIEFKCNKEHDSGDTWWDYMCYFSADLTKEEHEMFLKEIEGIKKQGKVTVSQDYLITPNPDVCDYDPYGDPNDPSPKVCPIYDARQKILMIMGKANDENRRLKEQRQRMVQH